METQHGGSWPLGRTAPTPSRPATVAGGVSSCGWLPIGVPSWTVPPPHPPASRESINGRLVMRTAKKSSVQTFMDKQAHDRGGEVCVIAHLSGRSAIPLARLYSIHAGQIELPLRRHSRDLPFWVSGVSRPHDAARRQCPAVCPSHSRVPSLVVHRLGQAELSPWWAQDLGTDGGEVPLGRQRSPSAVLVPSRTRRDAAKRRGRMPPQSTGGQRAVERTQGEGERRGGRPGAARGRGSDRPLGGTRLERPPGERRRGGSRSRWASSVRNRHCW